jgi:hypothetical protein
MKYAKSVDGLIHLKYAINSELTLCGDAFEGSCFAGGDTGAEWNDAPHGPVTCPRCAAIIKSCRNVKIKLEK